jgi:uncharacterized protein (DUF849 family)
VLVSSSRRRAAPNLYDALVEILQRVKDVACKAVLAISTGSGLSAIPAFDDALRQRQAATPVYHIGQGGRAREIWSARPDRCRQGDNGSFHGSYTP